ncbi:hypothetical protein [Heliophilum fasciatum]|uniref:Uncharacterized protein n=1 Tax=Heliophilum fasciatum TaxID=35700 RepID=A0A4V2SWJ5_9FIRM|nr:hypothetical protein [Heliophilum fasciatum]MCW2278745.1 hypothetical protein [Heliophilum fasciatum]TCP62516.1 hypothetical protein EDD73_12114 [Heliophilum fasciatum]
MTVINAFKNGTTVIDEATMNSLISIQPFALVYDGTQVDGKTGAGVYQFDNSSYDTAIYFTSLGVTEVARVELELVKGGSGADLVIEIRAGLVTDDSSEGILLKKMVLPAEFVTTSKAYVSIPFDLTGLTSGARYWLVVRKAGDATNYIRLHGEAAQDANYPTYQRNGAGAWGQVNSAHYKIFSGESGLFRHGIYGSGFTAVEYSGEVISKMYRYLPPAGTSQGGIRDVLTFTWNGSYLKRGAL